MNRLVLSLALKESSTENAERLGDYFTKTGREGKRCAPQFILLALGTFGRLAH